MGSDELPEWNSLKKFLFSYFSLSLHTHTHTHTHTMEHYSAIRKNETMPFAATWMDLRIITLSKTKLSLNSLFSVHYSEHTASQAFKHFISVVINIKQFLGGGNSS